MAGWAVFAGPALLAVLKSVTEEEQLKELVRLEWKSKLGCDLDLVRGA